MKKYLYLNILNIQVILMFYQFKLLIHSLQRIPIKLEIHKKVSSKLVAMNYC